MCHYITAVLPAAANREALAAIADRHGRQLEPIENPSIAARLKPGERYFLTTRSMCDCGTFLGALGVAEANRQKRRESADAEEQKLKRKGWSAAKIARWRAQKNESLARPLHSPQPTDWVAFLDEVLASGHTPSFGVLLHFYSGSLASRIELKDRRPVRAGEISPEVLGRMQEDVIYDFEAPGG